MAPLIAQGQTHAIPPLPWAPCVDVTRYVTNGVAGDAASIRIEALSNGTHPVVAAPQALYFIRWSPGMDFDFNP